MKKVVFVLVAWCVVGNAYAARMDVSRLTKFQEFSASFGLAFVTGQNRNGDAQTDFAAGRIKQHDLELAYTFTDDATLVFGTNNDYADSQIGLHYKIIKTFPLKLDFVTHYGIAWTRFAVNDDRIGNNNVDAGLRVSGILWCNLQWAFKVVGQYVWADPTNFWNIKTTTELMYYFYDDFAVQTHWDYDFSQISKPETLLDSSVHGGLVYNINARTSLNPYVKYHFRTKNSKTSLRNPNDYWKIGIGFSVQF